MNLTRIPPLGKPQDYRTYSLLAPLTTHWRNASCEEINCAVSASGWTTTVDEGSSLGQQQAWYIRNQSGRHFTERQEAEVTVFLFLAGEECFTAHRTKADREPLYMVRRGDYRGYGEGLQHDQPEHWVEDMAGHLDKLDRQR